MITNPILRLKNLFKRLVQRGRISSHYVMLSSGNINEEGRRLRDAWKDSSIPKKQRELVEQQLHQYRVGSSIDVFDVFINSLSALPNLTPDMSLLEVGCSSGYYSEVIESAKLSLEYTGCDYSPSFIEMARKKYPNVNFSVEDATDLHYLDNSFDIVVSGCCLLHIPEYILAVKEAVRVAKTYVIFHRTPVVWGQPNLWYSKLAYGVKTVEIHFNEPEFLLLLEECGLDLFACYTLDEKKLSLKKGYATRTYVCRKRI